MVTSGRRPTGESRASTRHEVELNARMGLDGEVTPCVLRNLSQGGAFAIAGRLPLGTTVTLWFNLPAFDHEIEVDAVVRWSTPDGAGLQFAGLRARDAWALGRFLEGLRGPRTAAPSGR